MSEHIPVLLEEAIDLLNIKEDGVYVDGTLGLAGHSLKIFEKLKTGQLYGFDLDESSLIKARKILPNSQRIHLIHDNYKNMPKYVNKVDGILLDLGVSSPQFDQAFRGFSYRLDGPLDMRMDQSGTLSGLNVVNDYTLDQLTKVLREYGQEKHAYKIALSIINSRPITTTTELVEAIKKGIPLKDLASKGHPCKQSFQAIRIEVNDELNSLKEFLNEFDGILNEGGRVVIISFQSLEDKLVKECFKKLSTVKEDKKISIDVKDIIEANYRLLNHGDKASEKEIETNRRAKSAIIRGIEKLWQE